LLRRVGVSVDGDRHSLLKAGDAPFGPQGVSFVVAQRCADCVDVANNICLPMWEAGRADSRSQRLGSAEEPRGTLDITFRRDDAGNSLETTCNATLVSEFPGQKETVLIKLLGLMIPRKMDCCICKMDLWIGDEPLVSDIA